MTNIYYRYSEDPTGTDPDNLVQGELINLNTKKIRFAIPKYSPFFTEGCSIYDNQTQRLLVKGVDYSFPVILKEATLRYGKEVVDSIMIENTEVSSQIRITYQCVGGMMQNNVDNIVKIYEAYANDSRKVNWANVINKPLMFTPAEHAHYLSEVFGFEPIVFELERIAEAIQLGNAPAFEAILEAIQDLEISEAEIDLGVGSSKFITLNRLMYALDKFNFNTVMMTPNQVILFNGGSHFFEIQATNVPESTMLYWVVKPITAQAADFAGTSGVVNLINGRGRFMVQAVLNQEREKSETFKLELHRTSINGPVMYTSPTMTLSEHDSYYTDHILEGVRIEDINSPRLTITARTYAAHMGAYNATFD